MSPVFKRYYAYQKLMFASFKAPVSSPVKMGLLFLVIVPLLWSIQNILGFRDTNLFFLPLGSLFLVYSIVNSDNKLYELVPVKPVYTIINIYLLSLGSMILIYLMMIAGTFIFIGLVLLLILISGGEVSQGPPDGLSIPDIPMEFNSMIFMIMLFLLIIFIGTTISLVKNNKMRYLSLAGFGTAMFIFLYTVKSTLPAHPQLDRFDFTASLDMAPNSDLIILGLGLFTLFAIPFSVWKGYKIYCQVI